MYCLSLKVLLGLGIVQVASSVANGNLFHAWSASSRLPPAEQMPMILLGGDMVCVPGWVSAICRPFWFVGFGWLCGVVS